MEITFPADVTDTEDCFETIDFCFGYERRCNYIMQCPLSRFRELEKRLSLGPRDLFNSVINF